MRGLWRRIQHEFRKRGFLNSVAVLVGGTAATQGVAVLASLLLARLYTPADFGVFAVYSSILSLLVVVASWRYELAIPMAKSDQEATNLLVLAFVILSGMTLLTSLVLLVSEGVVHWFSIPQTGLIRVVIPLSVFCVGAYQILTYWNTRIGQFGAIAKTKVSQVVAQVCIQLGMGVAGVRPLGLLAGDLVGRVVGIRALWRSGTVCLNGVTWTKCLAVARTYRKFPLYTVWAGLANAVGLQLPPLIFARYFSVETVGNYSLALRVLGLPASLVGQAVAQVFYPMAAKEADDADLRDTVERVASGLLLISFLIFGFILVQGPFLFSQVFGSQWTEAGLYARIMAPWLLFSFVSSPLSTFAYVKNQHKIAFWVSMLESGARVGSILLGVHIGSPVLSVLLFTLAGTAICLISIGWTLHMAGSSMWNLGRRLFSSIVAGVSIVIALLILDQVVGSWMSFLATCSVFCAYGVWTWRFLWDVSKLA